MSVEVWLLSESFKKAIFPYSSIAAVFLAEVVLPPVDVFSTLTSPRNLIFFFFLHKSSHADKVYLIPKPN